MVFPVIMYGCESWTIRIDAFELWCWRRLLRVPWTARRSNQSILKEINSEYWLEGLMLKLNSNTLVTWCQELTQWKRPWCWESLKAEGKGDDGGWDGWMASPTQWTWVWASSGSWWWTGKPGMLQSMWSQRVRRDWATELSYNQYGYHTHLCRKTFFQGLQVISQFPLVNSIILQVRKLMLKDCLAQSWTMRVKINSWLSILLRVPFCTLDAKGFMGIFFEKRPNDRRGLSHREGWRPRSAGVRNRIQVGSQRQEEPLGLGYNNI